MKITPPIALAVAAAVALLLWLTRYQVVDGSTMVLDRWTGAIIFPGSDIRVNLGDVETKKGKQ